MSTLTENIHFLNKTIENIKEQTENIQEQIKNIVISLNTIECDYKDNNKNLYDIFEEEQKRKPGIEDLSVMLKYLEEYRDTKNIYYLIKFLVNFYNNLYTSYTVDDKIRGYIYKKLFNVGDVDNDE